MCVCVCVCEVKKLQSVAMPGKKKAHFTFLASYGQPTDPLMRLNADLWLFRTTDPLRTLLLPQQRHLPEPGRSMFNPSFPVVLFGTAATGLLLSILQSCSSLKSSRQKHPLVSSQTFYLSFHRIVHLFISTLFNTSCASGPCRPI